MRDWGIVAPSLIPRLTGTRRKHDRKDAEDFARLYRAGELVTIRVPTERDGRVRDLVYREDQNWTAKHWARLRPIQRDAGLEAEVLIPTQSDQ